MLCYCTVNGLRAMCRKPKRVFKARVFPNSDDIFFIWNKPLIIVLGPIVIRKAGLNVRDIITMVEIIERLHQWGEDHQVMDALTGKVFMHVIDILAIGIERKLKIHLYPNDYQPQTVDKINRQSLCEIQVTKLKLHAIESRLQWEQVSHPPAWV